MTVLVPMLAMLACPSCNTIIPSNILYCWSCGKPIQDHERCGICGKPNGHRRHRGLHGLAYYCKCGFVATSKAEIMAHMEERI